MGALKSLDAVEEWGNLGGLSTGRRASEETKNKRGSANPGQKMTTMEFSPCRKSRKRKFKVEQTECARDYIGEVGEVR